VVVITEAVDTSPDIIIAPHEPGYNWTTRDVSQGETIYWNETVDLTKVEGWYGKVYKEDHESTVIDVSSFTTHIIVDPVVFPVGTYYQWAEFEEPQGNTLAFYVMAENTTIPVNETSVNFTGVNVSQVKVVDLPLERKMIGDILVARGDSLIYENPLINNKTRVWVFGRENYLYNISCQDGNFAFTSDQIYELDPNVYTIVLDNPGKNTITEAFYDPDKEEIYSPFIRKPVLKVAGLGPQVTLPKFRKWLSDNSDDEVTVLTMNVQDPYIEIRQIDMQYFDIDSLRVSGYTNLANQSEIYVTLDEDNITSKVIELPKFKTIAIARSPGEMRQWELNVPFDEFNATVGQHTVWAHGDYSALAIVQYYVYNMPEGQQTPVPLIKYVGGNEWLEKPTPEVVVTERVVTQEVIREVTVEVTPSDQQIRKQQEGIFFDVLVLIGQAIFFGGCGIGIILYLRSVYIRRNKTAIRRRRNE
jgi:hypothetical protein